jgi:hypothetical protein
MPDQSIHFLIRSVLIILYFGGVIALLKFLSRRRAKTISAKTDSSSGDEEENVRER